MQTRERTKLSDAIAAHKDALAEVERVEALLAQTCDKHADLVDQCAEDSSLDDEIAESRAMETVRAIESGAPIPTEAIGGFALRLTRREHIESELASIRAAIPVLESQLTKAKEHAEQCAFGIEIAVEAVVIAEAKQMAERYVEQLRLLREMLYSMRFMGARQVKRDPQQRRASNSGAPVFWGNETSRLINMPKSVLEAVADDCLGSSEYREGLRKRDAVSAAVSTYWGKLHVDPNAKLEIGELPKPFDSEALLRKLKVKA